MAVTDGGDDLAAFGLRLVALADTTHPVLRPGLYAAALVAFNAVEQQEDD